MVAIGATQTRFRAISGGVQDSGIEHHAPCIVQDDVLLQARPPAHVVFWYPGIRHRLSIIRY